MNDITTIAWIVLAITLIVIAAILWHLFKPRKPEYDFSSIPTRPIAPASRDCTKGVSTTTDVGSGVRKSPGPVEFERPISPPARPVVSPSRNTIPAPSRPARAAEDVSKRRSEDHYSAHSDLTNPLSPLSPLNPIHSSHAHDHSSSYSSYSLSSCDSGSSYSSSSDSGGSCGGGGE